MLGSNSTPRPILLLATALSLAACGGERTEHDSDLRASEGATSRCSAVRVGDVDADGFQDFAIAEPPFGEVCVRSGADGRVLARFDGGGGLGISAAALGDLTGDGIDELLLGDPLARRSHVCSGRSLEVLWSSPELRELQAFRGHRVAAAQHPSLAGATVFAVTSPAKFGVAATTSETAVSLYVASPGAALRVEEVGELTSFERGFGAGGVAFLELDGVLGVAVAGFERVQLYELRGDPLRPLFVGNYGDGRALGHIKSLVAVGDLDGDRHEDFAVGFPDDSGCPVRIVSSRTFDVLASWSFSSTTCPIVGEEWEYQVANMGVSIAPSKDVESGKLNLWIAAGGLPITEGPLLLQFRWLVAEASIRNDPKPMTRPALLRAEFEADRVPAELDSIGRSHGASLGGFVLPLSARSVGRPAELLTYEFQDVGKSKPERRLVVIDAATGAVLRRWKAR
jgi:hypothetical protein